MVKYPLYAKCNCALNNIDLNLIIRFRFVISYWLDGLDSFFIESYFLPINLPIHVYISRLVSIIVYIIKDIHLYYYTSFWTARHLWHDRATLHWHSGKRGYSTFRYISHHHPSSNLYWLVLVNFVVQHLQFCRNKWDLCNSSVQLN